MFHAPDHPYLVPFDGQVRLERLRSKPPVDAPDKKACRKALAKSVKRLADLQRRLYAHDRYAVLVVFQAMDAAGKDGTIRAVLSGINPAGCQVFSFKQPSKEELDHDFLWRTTVRLPERGRFGIFNRSHYEEVLVVKVHPEYLGPQRLPPHDDLEALWAGRYDSIRDHEKHLARNGFVILKFWLNVSRDEQRRRFLSRLREPEKHWKFSEKDVSERALWDRYMETYERALAETSRPWAPWYAIPADSKAYMRATVASIIVDVVEGLGVEYPTVDEQARARFAELRERLEAD